MKRSTFTRPLLCGLAGVGVASLALGAMLASPLKAPPPLASIRDGAAKLDLAGAPALSFFQARDGSWLGYRLFAAEGAPTGQIAILAHGSTGNSMEMTGVAKALAAAGVTAVAVDVRGHGASGQRGDVGYVGQVEDDLADLIDVLSSANPRARFVLAGFSLGGGFAARVAGSPLGARFERVIALSPFLGVMAPTNRPNEGAGHWAEADTPRILAIALLSKLGVTAAQSLPVIHYATAANAEMRQTPVYSYRLLTSYGPSYDWAATEASMRSASTRFQVIAGADDALMDAQAYERELRPLGVEVTVLPGVDHIGMVYQPAALAAIVGAVRAGKAS